MNGLEAPWQEALHPLVRKTKYTKKITENIGFWPWFRVSFAQSKRRILWGDTLEAQITLGAGLLMFGLILQKRIILEA